MVIYSEKYGDFVELIKSFGVIGTLSFEKKNIEKVFLVKTCLSFIGIPFTS